MKILLQLSIVFLIYSQKINFKTAFSIHLFQQQLKTEIGGESGEKLIENNLFSISFTGLYSINKFLKAGLFFDYETGNRNSAVFSHFDSSNRAISKNKSGGDFNELWFGPILHFYYKHYYLEIGHGTFSRRTDDGRTEILDIDNKNKTAFRTTASVSWKLVFGSTIELSKDLEAFFAVEYKVRYYDRRENELKNSVLGSQSISPLLGISFKL